MTAIKQIYRAFIAGPIYIILFGLIFFGIGFGLSYRQYALARDGAEANGVVTGLSQNCDTDGCTYTPVIRFTTQSGETISVQSIYSSSPPAYQSGDKVTVVYPLDAPEKADIKDAGKWFRIIFMIVGGVIILPGLIFFILAAKENLTRMREETPYYDNFPMEP